MFLMSSLRHQWRGVSRLQREENKRPRWTSGIQGLLKGDQPRAQQAEPAGEALERVSHLCLARSLNGGLQVAEAVL
jgi:hypothetical protein